MDIEKVKVLLKARMDSAQANAERYEQKGKDTPSPDFRRGYRSVADGYQKLSDELRDILRAIENNGHFRNMTFDEISSRNFVENPD